MTPATKAPPTPPRAHLSWMASSNVKLAFESVLRLSYLLTLLLTYLLSYYTYRQEYSRSVCVALVAVAGRRYIYTVSTNRNICRFFGDAAVPRTGPLVPPLQVFWGRNARCRWRSAHTTASRKDLAAEPATTSAPPNNRPRTLAPQQPVEDVHEDGPGIGRTQPFTHTPRPLSLTHTTA